MNDSNVLELRPAVIMPGNPNVLITPELKQNLAAVMALVRNKRYELDDRGRIHLPRLAPHSNPEACVGGVFDIWTRREGYCIEENLVVNVGLDYLLAHGLPGTSFYGAPFSNNVAPTSGLVAATVVGVLGEFTNYTESTRQLWSQDAEGSQAITNSASKMVITANTGGGTVWGFFMGTSSSKSATTGTLLCAAQFGAAKVLGTTDTLTAQYTIALSSM